MGRGGAGAPAGARLWHRRMTVPMCAARGRAFSPMLRAGFPRNRPVPDFLVVILLGLVEGLTEFLPISSTGHLLVAQHWLGPRSETFTIVIQAGAILAVTLVYRQRLWELLTRWREPANRDYLAKIGLAFFITAVLGYTVKKLGFTLPDAVTPIALALIIGGIWIIAAERIAKTRPPGTAITWKVAILVGLAQIVAAIFPGTSRSAATIFTALLAGANNRPAATEFAFLVGIPTMFAASGYEIFRQLSAGVDEDWSALALGFASATVTGFIAVRWLLGYIKRHSYTPFAIYRIVFGVVLLLVVPTGG